MQIVIVKAGVLEFHRCCNHIYILYINIFFFLASTNWVYKTQAWMQRTNAAIAKLQFIVWKYHY